MQFSLLNFRPKLTSLLFYSDDILFSRLEIILKISPVILFTVSSQNWVIWNIFKTSYGWTALILDNAIWGPFIFYRNLKPEQDGHLQFKLGFKSNLIKLILDMITILLMG